MVVEPLATVALVVSIVRDLTSKDGMASSRRFRAVVSTIGYPAERTVFERRYETRAEAYAAVVDLVASSSGARQWIQLR